MEKPSIDFIEELKAELRKKGAFYFRLEDDFIIFYHNPNVHEDAYLGCYYFPRHEHYEKFLHQVEIYEEVPTQKNYDQIKKFIERKFMFTKTSLENFVNSIDSEDREFILEEWRKNHEENNGIFTDTDITSH